MRAREISIWIEASPPLFLVRRFNVVLGTRMVQATLLGIVQSFRAGSTPEVGDHGFLAIGIPRRLMRSPLDVF
jgi:hypothetical protein